MGDAICSSCLLQFLGITNSHGHLTLFSCHHMLMVLERVSMVTSVLEFLCRLCLPLRSAHGNTEPFCIHCSPRASSLWAIAVASAQGKKCDTAVAEQRGLLIHLRIHSPAKLPHCHLSVSWKTPLETWTFHPTSPSVTMIYITFVLHYK